jgi:hypothetical protein
MKQEFPSTPLEAFLTSGRRVFDPIVTMAAEGDCMAPLIVYDMDPVTGRREKASKPEHLDDQGQRSLENMLLVWELLSQVVAGVPLSLMIRGWTPTCLYCPRTVPFPLGCSLFGVRFEWV